MVNNIEKIKQAMTEQKFSAILITDPSNILFATGFRTDDGALLITKNKALFFTDSRYIEAAGAIIKNADVLQVTYENSYTAQIKAVLDDNGIKSIGFEDGSVSYAEYLRWQEKLECELIPIKKTLDDLRTVKSEDDLTHLKNSQRIAEK